MVGICISEHLNVGQPTVWSEDRFIFLSGMQMRALWVFQEFLGVGAIVPSALIFAQI